MEVTVTWLRNKRIKRNKSPPPRGQLVALNAFNAFIAYRQDL
jgi:hypothetical protein